MFLRFEKKKTFGFGPAGFKRGVQKASDDMSYAAASPWVLWDAPCPIQEPHLHAPSLNTKARYK